MLFLLSLSHDMLFSQRMAKPPSPPSSQGSQTGDGGHDGGVSVAGAVVLLAVALVAGHRPVARPHDLVALRLVR